MKDLWNERFSIYARHRLFYITYILKGRFVIALLMPLPLGVPTTINYSIGCQL
ncbi:hypothetical protein ABFG93_16995 [Pseudalkalibacillus hwajinpoensis]|uniref:hypothetical protein n=1 Tax=Guptibacillus hwajinpoensis TaxID=208199 RepID=UPI00325ACABF